MKTIEQLLMEAGNLGSSEPLQKEAADNTAASEIEEIVQFLVGGGEKELSKEAQATLQKNVVSSDQELMEKIAESFITLETCIDLSLANLRDELIKEAETSGRGEDEINELITKVANQKKKGLSGIAKFLLGLGGAGALAGAGVAGHKVGYGKGRTDEFADIASALSTPYGGEGDMYYGQY